VWDKTGISGESSANVFIHDADFMDYNILVGNIKNETTKK
jgi:hypothetical protein